MRPVGVSFSKPTSMDTMRFCPTHRNRTEWDQEIKLAFNSFDVDGTGQVGYHELKAAMRALGFSIRKVEVLAAMHKHGCNETDRVSFDVFADIILKQFKDQDPRDTVLDAFRLFDSKGYGQISFRDFRQLSQDLGLHVSETDIANIIDQFDSNRDGEIDETDFVRAMRATSLH